MSNRILATAAVLTGVLLARGAGAQTSAPSNPAPNLSGVWTITNFRQNLWEMSPELAAAKAGPPYTPEAAARYKAIDHATVDTGPSSRCLPPGVAFLMTMPYALEIIQIPGRVLTYHEFGNYVRQIFVDGRDHADAYPTWLGHSTGRYENDTLVVDTVGFNGKGWQDMTGMPGSDALHTVERFKRTSPTDLDYSMTLEDPKVFTKPWTIQAKFRLQPTFNIVEFVCMENNLYVGSPGMKVEATK